jgi:dGTPase
LGGIDPDAAEAAGLAHDLGHPPFGHIAEDELNDLLRDEGVSDGYEGTLKRFASSRVSPLVTPSTSTRDQSKG